MSEIYEELPEEDIDWSYSYQLKDNAIIVTARAQAFVPSQIVKTIRAAADAKTPNGNPRHDTLHDELHLWLDVDRDLHFSFLKKLNRYQRAGYILEQALSRWGSYEEGYDDEVKDRDTLLSSLRLWSENLNEEQEALLQKAVDCAIDYDGGGVRKIIDALAESAKWLLYDIMQDDGRSNRPEVEDET